MAVAEQTPYIEYVANGVTTSFALGFDCEKQEHLIVLVDELEPPIATWSLSGGNVVFTTAPAAGKKIAVQRNTPFSRTTDYQSYNNSFRPQPVNKDFDKIWHVLQEQNYKVGQYDYDYSYAINTSNQALSDAATAQQRADDAYDLADTTNTETRPIERGGTSASTAAGARTNLNVYSQDEVDALIASGGAGNVVGITGGGTGASTAAGARTNLDVMSSSEVATAIANATPTIPNATETVAGVAKIATTAIAQAGTNDTDIITAKKLRNALNAEGSAPVSAVRAYCAFNGASAPVIYNESNVLSIAVAGSTAALLKFTVTFKTPMPTKDYAISGFCSDVSNSNRLAGITMNPDDIINKTVNGFDFWCRYASGGSLNIAPALITFTIVC